jgi:hypothetical protein
MNPCDKAQNLLKIIDNQPPNGVKRKFAICTKPLNIFDGVSPIKLIEWVEMMKILGAEQIFIYHRYINAENFRVMKYYEKKGFMDLSLYLEPSGVSGRDGSSYEGHVNEYPIFNDCLYRVRNLFKYVVALDTDEILIPVNESLKTWKSLIKSSGVDRKVDSYGFRSVTYSHKLNKISDKVPPYYYMLQHVQRAKLFGHFPIDLFNYKSIMATDNLVSIHTHGTVWCLNRECDVYYLNETVGQCSHYRNSPKQPSDKDTMKDKILWKYKDELIRAVETVLNELSFNRSEFRVKLD